MFILLVGPKGSGKSHIGRILERRLGVAFFQVVEPLRTAAVAAARQAHDHVCVETTGASEEILTGLRALAPRTATLIVTVTAPLDVSAAAPLQPDVAIADVDIDELEIVALFAPLLRGGSARDLDDLAARFVAGTVPRAEWTHLTHLAVGSWHVHRYGPVEALARLRSGIRSLNDRHGTPNTDASGYHETITRAYVTLLAGFLPRFPAETPLAERVAGLFDSPLADKDVLLKCYGRERLMSAASRAGWTEPDLAPLDTILLGRETAS